MPATAAANPKEIEALLMLALLNRILLDTQTNAAI
jgi:hypothetical protein